MMKEELSSPHQVAMMTGATDHSSSGQPIAISGKFEELLHRCAQLESENALLAYKLARMKRQIRRLGQDNAFIQRRLREHLKRKEEAISSTNNSNRPNSLPVPSQSSELQREASITSDDSLAMNNGHINRTPSNAYRETQRKPMNPPPPSGMNCHSMKMEKKL